MTRSRTRGPGTGSCGLARPRTPTRRTRKPATRPGSGGRSCSRRFESCKSGFSLTVGARRQLKPDLQRLEKRYQVRHLLLRQVERPDGRVEVRVGAGAAVVELHHLLERLHAAVVHVRGGQLHGPQGRRLVLAPVGVLLRDREPPEVVLAPGDAGVVVALVGKVRPGVAPPALAFALVEPQAVQFGRGRGGAVAFLAEPVDRAVAPE